MKRYSILTCLIFSVSMIAICGCQSNTSHRSELIDYNQYIYSHGCVAYTDEAYVFFENGQLTFLEPSLSAPLSTMCIRPDCDHVNAHCSSYVDTSSIFASGNNLYYVAKDKNQEYGIYEMNLKGEDRKRIKELTLINDASIGFTYRLYDSLVALETTKWTAEASTYSIYLIDLTNKHADPKLILGGNNNSKTIYAGTELRDGWVFAKAYDTETQERSLVGYNIESGQVYTLISDWNNSNVFSLRDNVLYWFSQEKGFFSLSLDDFQSVQYRSSFSYEDGPAIYDDQFLYLTNALPSLADIATEKRGLYIYDYEGTLKQFLPLENSSISPVFLLSTPDYVFFFDANGSMAPQWYIEKAKIRSGEVELLSVE